MHRSLRTNVPFKEGKIVHMRVLWRICLTALLVLQAIALPAYALAQEAQHLAFGVGHHHEHNHTNHVTSDRSDDIQLNSDSTTASPVPSVESGEHVCVSHCHVPAAILGETALFDSTGKRFIVSSLSAEFDQYIPRSIERPKWSAARY